MAVLDITRFLEQPRKHYSGARMQQGRLLLDADFNEGSEAGEDDQRQAVLDLVGPMGSPDEGFSLGEALPPVLPVPQVPQQTEPLQPGDEVSVESIKLNGVMTDVHGVSIRAGSYYVGGRRFTNEQAEHIAMQRDWLQMRPSDVPETPETKSRLVPRILDQASGLFATPSGSVELLIDVADQSESPALVVFVATQAETETDSQIVVVFEPDGVNTTMEKFSSRIITAEVENDEGATVTVFTEVSVHVLLADALPATGGGFEVVVIPEGPQVVSLSQAYALRDVDPDPALLRTLIIERGLGSQIEAFLANPDQILLSAMGTIDGSGLAVADDSTQDISEGKSPEPVDLAFAASHVVPAHNPQRVQFIAGADAWNIGALIILSLRGLEVPETISRIMYFLHAWEQSVSAVEDEELLETALGRSETSTRIRRMRRVEMLGGVAQTTCEAAWKQVLLKLTKTNADFDKDSGELKSRGRLQLFFLNQNEADDCDDCLPDPAVRFLGVDNQTLRIMLTGSQSYVWALDNATPLYRVKVTGLDDEGAEVEVELLTPPSDETQWPLTNRVVEIVPFGAIIEGDMPISAESPFFKKVAERVGAFTRVSRSFDPNTRKFTIDKKVGLDAIKNLVHEWDSRHPGGRRLIFETEGDERFFYLRMWHMAPNGAQVELPINGGRPLRGTNILPLFQPGRRGDFWTAALRPGTADRCVPVDLARAFVPPHGPRDFYAPVALLVSNDAEDEVINAADCRPRIQPLSDNGCITVTVGDGAHSQGDFLTISEALRALPSTGGRIVVRPGVYRENIAIESTIHDVVIEGCGDNTVIETPAPIPSPLATSPVETNEDTAVVHITGQRVTLSSLRINAIGQHAVLATDTAQDISLRGVSIVAGIRVGRDFKAGALSVGRPLVAIAETDGLDLRGVVIEPHARPALDIDDCQRVTLEDVTLAGPQASPLPPTEAMVTIRGSYLVSFRNSIISTFGQVGVHVVGTVNHDVELSELSIISGAHNNGATQSRSAVDIDGGDRIRLERSTITMDQSLSEHAAVVVLGTALQIVDNQLEVLARCFTSPSPSPPSPNRCPSLRIQAWGGIHVRGGSENIEIRGNRILGGVGHGITLGSLLYKARANDPVTDRRDRPGAGRGQMGARADRHLAPTGLLSGVVTGPQGGTVVARDEGPLTNINIVDNRIEGMNGNGISVLSVFGMPGNDELIEVRDLRIERNTIINNLAHPYDRLNLRGEVLPFSTSTLGSGAPIPRLPHAGIALGATVGVDIRENFIVGNGTSNTLPINGIFVLCGDAIRIANNRITGNGGRALLPGGGRAGPQPGIRAGIAVMLAGTDQRDRASRLGVMLRSPITLPPEISTDGLSLAVLNNTVRQPEGRALHIVATGPVAIDSNFLSSDGNHGSDTVIDNSSVGDIVYIQNLGAPWEQSLPGVNGRPDEAEHFESDFNATVLPSTAAGTEQYIGDNLAGTQPQRPTSPWFFVGQGGQVLFTNNQVTFDWQVLRLPTTGTVRPLALFPVAILSLDHVTVDSNQFALRLRSAFTNQVRGTQAPAASLGAFEPILSHVFVLAATAQVGGNRCSEGVGDTTLSLLIAGNLMTLVTFNQTTSEIIAARDLAQNQPNPLTNRGPHRDTTATDEQSRLLRRGNQVMFVADYWSTPFGVDPDRIVQFSEQFLRLVFRPSG